MKIAKRDSAKIEELLVELFWTIQVYRKKLMEIHDYSQLSFSYEKRRLESREARLCTIIAQNK